MKKFLLLMAILLIVSPAWATLTANVIPVAATGGSTPTIKNSDITDNPGVLISTTVPITASNAGNLINIPYVKVSETESSGTSAGASVTGSWITRVLNTKDSDTASIASLGSNLVTLPAGTYLVKATVPFNGTENTQTRLYDTTHSTLLLNGTCVYGTPSTSSAYSNIIGIITLSSQSALAVQYQCSYAAATNGLGQASSFGTEVYTVAEFKKIS
jgi:hypothetical protein